MRVYVPMTLPRLAGAYSAGEIGPPPLVVYAVTPALREWYAGGSDEELEYAALTQAARSSLELLAGSRASRGPARRVAAACEVELEPARDGAAPLGDARLTLGTAVPWSKVAAVLVDSVEAAEVVAAALAVWDAAHNGDEDAAFAVDACEGEELLWYATQEVPDLLTEVGVSVERPAVQQPTVQQPTVRQPTVQQPTQRS